MTWVKDGITPAEVVAVLTIIGLVSGGMRVAWVKVIRRLMWLIDDMQGEPARPGQPARPGWAERLEAIESEVTHNGGGSMKDATSRIEQALEENSLITVDLSRKLDDHLADAVRLDERIHHLEVDVHRLPCDQCDHVRHGDPQT